MIIRPPEQVSTERNHFLLSSSFQFLEFSFCKKQKTELYLKFVIGWDCQNVATISCSSKVCGLASGYYLVWVLYVLFWWGGEVLVWHLIVFSICTSPWGGGGGGKEGVLAPCCEHRESTKVVKKK